MTYTVVGLGNPGEEYKNTRHNTGRVMVEALAKKLDAEFAFDKKLNGWKAKGKEGKVDFVCVLPDTFMNNSGGAVKPLVASAKAAERLIVVHDDFDLPIGSMRIVFDRGPGGHNGVKSVMKAIKTEAFSRVRVGIAPVTPSGKKKTIHGAEAVEKFILGEFASKEQAEIKKLSKKVTDAIVSIAADGREIAMGKFN